MDFSWPAIVGLISALWGGTPAADFDSTPKSLLEAVYRQSPAIERTLSDTDIYSERLQNLFYHYNAEQNLILTSAAADPVPVDLLAFDPLSTETATENVVISEPVVRDDQATATVSFEKDGKPVQLSFYLVAENDKWRIDDIAAFGDGGQPWLLSWLLRYDPLSAE